MPLKCVICTSRYHREMESFLDICKEANLSRYSVNFQLWEDSARKLPELIKSGPEILRKTISELPELNLDEMLDDLGSIQRVYTVATFLAHGYIRGGSNDICMKKLPRNISCVWIGSADLLGVPPIATYAATVLFNYNLNQKYQKYQKSIESADDFEILFTFTGTEDEKWFYAISAAVDLRSREIIKLASRMNEMDIKGEELNEIGHELSEQIRDITAVLNRIYERCRPDVFYRDIRRYLAGWFNDPEFKESGGLVYELPCKTVTMNLAGGSAAQNPTIQLIDILLGVKHDEMMSSDFHLEEYKGTTCANSKEMDYLGAMRTYMPKEHREFLNLLETRINNNEALSEFKKTDGFRECVRAMTEFRSEHLKMVTLYIICQSNTENVQGTGGSNPIPFLKSCRIDTENALDT